MELDRNDEAMRALKEQRLKEKSDVKQFWHDQLTSKQQLKDKEAEAQRELKKKIDVAY